MKRKAPRIEPDMVRYMLHMLRSLEGPDAVVRRPVDRIDVGTDGGVLVTFVLRRPSGPIQETETIQKRRTRK